jgi:hypothetical protein
MVDVAQLVEPRVVIPVVVGSSPIVHPIFLYEFIHFDIPYCYRGRINEDVKIEVKINEKLYSLFTRKVYCSIIPPNFFAKVAELVDALDLGSSGATRESSSLSFRTIHDNFQRGARWMFLLKL